MRYRRYRMNTYVRMRTHASFERFSGSQHTKGQFKNRANEVSVQKIFIIYAHTRASFEKFRWVQEYKKRMSERSERMVGSSTQINRANEVSVQNGSENKSERSERMLLDLFGWAQQEEVGLEKIRWVEINLGGLKVKTGGQKVISPLGRWILVQKCNISVASRLSVATVPLPPRLVERKQEVGPIGWVFLFWLGVYLFIFISFCYLTFP